MEWHQLPWSFFGWLLGGIIAFIVWLIRLEARAGSNKREIEITNERVSLVNARVSANETLLAEVRATTTTKADLKDHEERMTRSIDAVGRQVSVELDRLVRVIETPKPKVRN